MQINEPTAQENHLNLNRCDNGVYMLNKIGVTGKKSKCYGVTEAISKLSLI